MASMVNDDSETPWRAAAKEELSQSLDDLLYTEKTHFAAAERYHRANRMWGSLATVLSAGAAATIVANWNEGVAGILALAAAIVSAVMTFRSLSDSQSSTFRPDDS